MQVELGVEKGPLKGNIPFKGHCSVGMAPGCLALGGLTIVFRGPVCQETVFSPSLHSKHTLGSLKLCKTTHGHIYSLRIAHSMSWRHMPGLHSFSHLTHIQRPSPWRRESQRVSVCAIVASPQSASGSLCLFIGSESGRCTPGRGGGALCVHMCVLGVCIYILWFSRR